MRIKRKLQIGFGVVLLMLVVVTGLSAWLLSRSRCETAHLENTFLQQMELARLLTLINRQMKELGEYAVTGHEEELTEFHEAGQGALETFDEWRRLIVLKLDRAADSHREAEVRELDVLDHCRAEYLALMDTCHRVVELTRSGEQNEAIALLESHVEVACDENIKTVVEKQLQSEQSEIAGLHDSIWRLYGFARALTVGLAFFALVGAGLAPKIATQAIARPLARLQEAAARIGQGHLDTEIDITSDDEVGELATTLSRMAHDLRQTTTSIDALQHEVAQREKAEANLAAINEELGHFAYVVSHDLKAPLRGIKLLTDWLATDYCNRLGVEAEENLNLLQNRVKRMHNLIEGVLQYSRIGLVQEDRVEVDLNELLPGIIDAIAPPEHMTITIERPVPSIKGEPTRIAQIFQNLLTNAVKYMDKPVGEILVGYEDTGDTWTFRVTDNGPGIEARHFDRIFKIFQTLAARDEYESTGVGLTLVKKSVELYGGRIWVESEVGKGSTFFFTFPKQPVEPRIDSTSTGPASQDEGVEEPLVTSQA